MSNSDPGLFERWLALEKATGRSLKEILGDLNAAAGTSYRHNWPSLVASRGYQLVSWPVGVRRYMMRVVLEDALRDLDVQLSESQLDHLVCRLS